MRLIALSAALALAASAAVAQAPQTATAMLKDGKGQALGRSFKVKLWPTLIFMRNGQEVERLVRPTSAADIRAALERIDNT